MLVFVLKQRGFLLEIFLGFQIMIPSLTLVLILVVTFRFPYLTPGLM